MLLNFYVLINENILKIISEIILYKLMYKKKIRLVLFHLQLTAIHFEEYI